MNNFGRLKDEILNKLTELYEEKNMVEIKKILRLIKEDKNFKELYLFYDNIENTFVDTDLTDEYVKVLSEQLEKKCKLISKTCKKIKNQIGEVEISPNPLYESLDIISEPSAMRNLDKKLKAKKILKEHLSTIKNEKTESKYTVNEGLLYSVLTNKFNNIYTKMLSEQQRKELKEILVLKKEEMEDEIKQLREDVLDVIDNLMTEDINDVYAGKLKKVKDEVENITTTRFNYFRLKSLKNSLSKE